jgi:ABC-type nitrate/sulfonate/bicarbonate transport system ATPase subunit
MIVGPADASRISDNQLQALQITDRGEPVGQARYFGCLSGGERFRVALALHRRVGRAVGTLIDEGFGAVDGYRREALARIIHRSAECLIGPFALSAHPQLVDG